MPVPDFKYFSLSFSASPQGERLSCQISPTVIMTQKYKKMTENNRSGEIVKNSTEKLVFNFRHLFWGVDERNNRWDDRE